MSWRRFLAATAFLAVPALLAPGGALAQGRQYSTIIGTVKDTTGAVLPGVRVTLSSPDLVGGAQTVTTDAEGKYRFTQLPVGLYELTFEMDGFKRLVRSELRVPVATTLTLDAPMELAALLETVTVTGESPVVDITSSSSSTEIDDAILQNVPMQSRFQPNVINLAPGVVASVALGGTQSSNALLMDGVDVSDPEGGTPWSFFNYNWIEEVQIVALGANAEYGEFSGIAANSVVRSGSNKFSGLFEYWTTRNSWLANNTGGLSESLQKRFRPREIDTLWDSTAQIGGPILKDKLFFFGGFQYFKRIDRPPGFTGGFEEERDPRVITKINWAASPKVRVEGFYEWDKYDIKGRGAGPDRPPETTVIEPSPEINWNVRLAWTISDRTLLDIRNGGYDGYFPLEPTPPNTRQGPPGHYDGDTSQYSVNTIYYGRFDRTPVVTAATLTHFAEKFAGRHEFKFGFEFERAKIRNDSGYPGGKWYYDLGGEPYIAYLWDGYVIEATKKRTTFYAQDSWQVNDRLTINPGIRVNINRGSVPEKGTVFKTNPVSPRIGIALDLLGDNKTVLRAHYGRYHDALLANTFEFMDTSGQNTKYTALVHAPGGCRNGLGRLCEEIDRFEPLGNFGIDDDISHSYVDQFLVGVERELFPDFSLEAQYIRRNFDNFLGFVDTRSRYQPVQRQDPGPDNRLGTRDDGAFITVFNLLNPGESFRLLTNPEDAFRRYDGFQLIGRKRYSRDWQLVASYTWSKTEGTVSNRGGNNSGSAELGQTGIFANPNAGINREGRAIFDYTHQVKIEGTYRIPYWGGFFVAGVYRYTSGLAWGRRATIRGLSHGLESVLIEPRGTRRLDAINYFDLRVEKTFDIGQGRTIGGYLDLFNVNNQGVTNSASRLAVQDASGSSFGQPRRWIDPRQLRVGVRFSF